MTVTSFSHYKKNFKETIGRQKSSFSLQCKLCQILLKRAARVFLQNLCAACNFDDWPWNCRIPNWPGWQEIFMFFLLVVLFLAREILKFKSQFSSKSILFVGVILRFGVKVRAFVSWHEAERWWQIVAGIWLDLASVSHLLACVLRLILLLLVPRRREIKLWDPICFFPVCLTSITARTGDFLRFRLCQNLLMARQISVDDLCNYCWIFLWE